MMLAAFIFAATLRYESILTKYDGPVFEAGAAKYEFYAEGEAGGGRKVVVHGFTPVRRGPTPEVDLQIYVAMIARKGDGTLSSRRGVKSPSPCSTSASAESSPTSARA